MGSKLFLTLGLFLPHFIFSQNLEFSKGAAQMAFADASVAVQSEWSLWSNPAGLSGSEQSSCHFSVRRTGDLPFLNQYSSGYTFPIRKMNFGLLINRYGGQEYNEQSIAFGLAHKIAAVSLGWKCNLLQIHQEGQESKISVLMEFGGIIDLSEHLRWGAHVSNVNQPALSKKSDAVAPTTFRSGFFYLPWNQLELGFEIEKNMNFPLNVKTGFGYHFFKKFVARAGLNTDPLKTFYGMGFSSKRLTIDYALSEHYFLGFTNEISLSIHLKSKKD